jgi:hypothetical protein
MDDDGGEIDENHVIRRA